MAGIQGNNEYPQSYLADIEKQALKRMDDNGNKDGKVTVNEALKELNISSLLAGQNEADTAKIQKTAANIESVLKQYAGDDGEFNAKEWANFLNGKEWGAVLDAWHSSGKKTKLEMQWTDQAHIPDMKVTKGEVKVGILNNLLNNQRLYNDKKVDTTQIEALIDKYAGPDGTFTFEEFHQMKNDPIYKQFVEQNHVVPWFQFGV